MKQVLTHEEAMKILTDVRIEILDKLIKARIQELEDYERREPFQFSKYSLYILTETQMQLTSSISNPVFTTLLQRRFPERITPIPNDALPPVYQDAVQAIWKELGGSEPVAKNYYSVYSENTTFGRLIIPQVARKGDQIGVQWGDVILPIIDTDFQTKKLSFEAFNVSGQGIDICLKLTVVIPSKGVHSAYFPVRLLNRETEIDTLTLHAVSDYDALVQLVSEPYSNLPTYSLNELNVGTYLATASETRNVSWGQNHILTILPNPDVEDPRFHSTFRCWGNRVSFSALKDCEVSEDKPATLEVVGHSMSKKNKPIAACIATPFTQEHHEGAIDISKL